MAIINCPECGRQVSSAAPSCLHCGYKISDYKSLGNYEKKIHRRRNTIIGYVGILLAIFVIYAIYRTCESDVGNKNTSRPEQISDSALMNVSHEDKNDQLQLHNGYNNEEIVRQIMEEELFNYVGIKPTFEYEIVNAEPFNTHKCNFYVRIQEPLSEGQIKVIAKKIRAGYPSFERLLIFYFLPEMKFTEGAYATSHYQPNLKIRILGTPEKLDAKIERSKPIKDATQEKKEIDTKILGRWDCNTPGVKHEIHIYMDGNIIKAKQIWPFDFEDVETIKEGKNGRYDIVTSKFGEFYVLKPSGILELWDMDGKFAIATKK